MYNGVSKLLHIGVRAVLLSLVTFSATGSFAQDAKQLEKPKDVKVVREYEDGKGNIVRELQYKQGSMIVTETVIMPKPIKIGAGMAIRADTLNRDSLII
ncbi:MAG TPA: hypothetical protein VEB40_04080, partial [Flavipsychrobacter sp.]|nr:hypothetical protein [Flavipsychrobacter sp.]